MINRETNEKCSALFFKFIPGEKKSALVERLSKIKETGIYNVIASYEAKGLKETILGEDYFNTLPSVAEACNELGMTFWIEDYSPFPTGSANGAYKEEKNAHLNKLFIDERHMDIRGPLSNAVIRIDALQNVVYGASMHRFTKMDPAGRKRIAVIAYRMSEHTSACFEPVLEEDSGVILDTYVENGYLKWSVPKGYWRIFVIFTTYESSGRPNYINLLSKDSVALEISKVHEPIYNCLKHYLGHSWNGFFYDEPEIGNAGGDGVFDYFMLPGRRTKDKADCNVFPWSTEMPAELEKRDSDWVKNLPFLWYNAQQTYKKFQFNYMDAVTSLVRNNYGEQVYSFCNERGINYIGHVLEDEGSHTRLGCGTGHYFREQYYQDEAGIDVIAGQILPGRDWSASWYGSMNADGEFYHYGLAKLASSEAHINPIKHNHSVCETYAMYGQQGLAEKKFLVDHLLINGINRFLFGELNTYDAPNEYAKVLANYADSMCKMLRNSDSVIKTAILYNAETEWLDNENAQGFQTPAGELAKHQISYDVIPADVFSFPERYKANFQNGLTVNGNKYEALIIPGCAILPDCVQKFAEQSEKTNFPVIFTDCMPDNQTEQKNGNSCCKKVPLKQLAEEVLKCIQPDIKVESDKKEWIRYEHIVNNGKDLYLIYNESPEGSTDCKITFNIKGNVIQEDPISGLRWIPDQKVQSDSTTSVSVTLGLYEMILLYSETDNCNEVLSFGKVQSHEAEWTVELPDGRVISGTDGKLPDLSQYLESEFYGKLIYRTSWNADDILPTALSLGDLSDCCEVTINGKNLGKRIAAPYLYDVRNAVKSGKNELTAEVYTSAANKKIELSVFGIPMNSLTAYPYMTVETPGISGKVRWFFER